jgi:endonuclease/exonuclease/phosphatase family metal-dependent hydrolase
MIGGRPVRVYSIHLDSNIREEDREYRQSAVEELIADAAGFDGPVIMGGDFNVINYTMDLMLGTGTDRAVEALFAAGFHDAHAGLPAARRGTTGRDFLVRGIIDLIFVKNAEPVGRGICSPGLCGPLSDHLPVWARVGP